MLCSVIGIYVYQSLRLVWNDGDEQGWLAHCQIKVNGWGIMFICGMVLLCADKLKSSDFSLDQLQQI